MRLAVDSSSLAKRYVQEDGSEEMDSLLHHASELALCIILLPEIISALNRLQRERVLTVTDYRKRRDFRIMSQTGLLKNYGPPPVNDRDSQYSIRCFRWAVNFCFLLAMIRSA